MKEEILHKFAQLDHKKVDVEAGTFEGIASEFMVKDLDNETVAKGAAKKNLMEEGPTRPLLFSHNSFDPIGVGHHTETEKAIIIKGEINKEVQSGREKLALLRQKALDGISMGFRIFRDKMEQTTEGLTIFKEIQIKESSLCVFPCSPTARVNVVKNARLLISDDFRKFLEDLDTEEKIKKESSFLEKARERINALLGSLEENLEPYNDPFSGSTLSDKEAAELEESLKSMTSLLKGK